MRVDMRNYRLINQLILYTTAQSEKEWLLLHGFKKNNLMNSSTEVKKLPSILGGIMIIAGTTIGGGMIAIPIATAGIWFYRSIFVLIYAWFCMTISGLMLVETNLHYPKGASFDTMVKDLLGKKWNIITGVTISFVLYTLVYAYITVGGSITTEIINENQGLFAIPNQLGGGVFCVILAVCVWISTKVIDRLSTILIIAMVLSFIGMSTGLLKNINFDFLSNAIDPKGGDANYWKYFFFALPVCVTSFCFHGTAPSITMYYDRNGKATQKAIIWGSLIAFVVYFIWLASVQGTLPRHEFISIFGASDEVRMMIERISQLVAVPHMGLLIDFFTYMAIISSFLGASLGLFDYLADLFNIKDTKLGRLKTASITFLPPLIFAMLFPYGFVTAIGYVGFAAAIWSILVPALMVLESRKRFKGKHYRVWGGKPLVYFIIAFALLTIASMLITELNIIEAFGKLS